MTSSMREATSLRDPGSRSNDWAKILSAPPPIKPGRNESDAFGAVRILGGEPSHDEDAHRPPDEMHAPDADGVHQFT